MKPLPKIIITIITLSLTATAAYFLIPNLTARNQPADTTPKTISKPSELIEAGLEVKDDAGRALENFPITLKYNLGKCAKQEKSEARYKTITTDQNGNATIEICSGQNVYISSGNPDWRIEDTFCEKNTDTDCRYSARNFTTKEISGTGLSGHRLRIDQSGEIKPIRMKTVIPRLTDLQYYDQATYTKLEQGACLEKTGEVCVEGWGKFASDNFEFKLNYPTQYLAEQNISQKTNNTDDSRLEGRFIFKPNSSDPGIGDTIYLEVYSATSTSHLEKLQIEHAEEASPTEKIGAWTGNWFTSKNDQYNTPARQTFLFTSENWLFKFYIETNDEITPRQNEHQTSVLKAVIGSFERIELDAELHTMD